MKPCHAGSGVCSMLPTSGQSSSTISSPSTVWSLPNWWEEDLFSKVGGNIGMLYKSHVFTDSLQKPGLESSLLPLIITEIFHRTLSSQTYTQAIHNKTCSFCSYFSSAPPYSLVFFFPGFPLSTLSVLLVTYCGVQLVKERERKQALLDDPDPVKPIDGGKAKAE